MLFVIHCRMFHRTNLNFRLTRDHIVHFIYSSKIINKTNEWEKLFKKIINIEQLILRAMKIMKILILYSFHIWKILEIRDFYCYVRNKRIIASYIFKEIYLYIYLYIYILYVFYLYI